MTGQELKAWRERHGLTQEQLAALLAMPWETYRKQENGYTAVNALMELSLCEVERRHKLKHKSTPE